MCGSDRSISVDVGAIQTIDEDVTLDFEGRMEAKIGRRDCSGVPVAGISLRGRSQVRRAHGADGAFRGRGCLRLARLLGVTPFSYCVIPPSCSHCALTSRLPLPVVHSSMKSYWGV